MYSLVRHEVERKHPCLSLKYNLYGCETWSLILRGEDRLRVLENRVLRGDIEGLRRNRRKFYNEKLHHLYLSPNVIMVIQKDRRDGMGTWHVG
jgi:hypothetical protein